MVFADTFAFIAWLNPRDPYYRLVDPFLESYRGKFLTTEWILVELADALASPEFRTLSATFIRDIRSDPQFEIVGYDPVAYNAGFALYESRRDKDWPLTDCISFAVMTERGLIDALTADRHFEQAGCIRLLKE